jgi:NAD(P)-dependent dehydrogenase (short-subunit alcohol dehydrogenase family)
MPVVQKKGVKCVMFQNQVGIVTGASQGIGLEIARSLSNAGMKLALVARSQDRLERLQASLPEESLVLAKDLRLPDSAQSVVQSTLEHFGALHALVNNAGATKRGAFLELSDMDWADGYALKFFGAMRLCRAAWSALQASSGGIVNIAGIGGRTASAEFTIGGSVNAALMYLTKALADQGVHDGVRVNAINPGAIATERLQTRVATVAAQKNISAEEAALEMAKSLGIAQYGQPKDIAEVVVFLLSREAKYIQGAILDVDGGQNRGL